MKKVDRVGVDMPQFMSFLVYDQTINFLYLYFLNSSEGSHFSEIANYVQAQVVNGMLNLRQRPTIQTGPTHAQIEVFVKQIL